MATPLIDIRVAGSRKLFSQWRKIQFAACSVLASFEIQSINDYHIARVFGLTISHFDFDLIHRRGAVLALYSSDLWKARNAYLAHNIVRLIKVVSQPTQRGRTGATANSWTRETSKIRWPVVSCNTCTLRLIMLAENGTQLRVYTYWIGLSEAELA